MHESSGRALAVAICILLVVHSAAAQQPATAPNPMDSISKLPSYRPAHDSIPLLTSRRIASLERHSLSAWNAYIAHSRRQYDRDTAAMNAELRSLGTTTMTRAPYTHGFEVGSSMTPMWFHTDSARRIAENILSFQAPNGGWSKLVDFMQQPRQRGQSYFAESEQWSWISTIDNSSTTEELKFLALIDDAQSGARYATAFMKGVDYLLEMQFPNGCWPQVWPLEGSYHDAATYNDDATVNAAQLLQDVAAGKYRHASPEQRLRASRAVTRTVDCIVRSQAIENGKLAVWGQQHDPLTLQLTSARSYELTSLTAQESANIMRFLMSIPSPSARVIASVRAAAGWLEAHRLYGYTYTFDGGRKQSPGAGPLWARMYEIGTGRPIFSDRNGIMLYDWDKLNDRRHGYGWYTYAPAGALNQYERWALSHPPAPPAARARAND